MLSPTKEIYIYLYIRDRKLLRQSNVLCLATAEKAPCLHLKDIKVTCLEKDMMEHQIVTVRQASHVPDEGTDTAGSLST